MSTRSLCAKKWAKSPVPIVSRAKNERYYIDTTQHPGKQKGPYGKAFQRVLVIQTLPQGRPVVRGARAHTAHGFYLFPVLTDT